MSYLELYNKDLLDIVNLDIAIIYCLKNPIPASKLHSGQRGDVTLAVECGMDKMTKLPPGAVLMFEEGVALHCEGENHPCRFPGDFIENQNQHLSGIRKAFIREATGCRGLVASVERPGKIQVGEAGRILLP